MVNSLSKNEKKIEQENNSPEQRPYFCLLSKNEANGNSGALMNNFKSSIWILAFPINRSPDQPLGSRPLIYSLCPETGLQAHVLCLQYLIVLDDS